MQIVMPRASKCNRVSHFKVDETRPVVYELGETHCMQSCARPSGAGV